MPGITRENPHLCPLPEYREREDRSRTPRAGLRIGAGLTQGLPKRLIVGALVLAAAVIIPLLRAKRVFAPHTPLAFGTSAPRASLRRRLGVRRGPSPRESIAPRADGAALASRDASKTPEAHGELPLPRGRRVSIGVGAGENGDGSPIARAAAPLASAIDVSFDCPPPSLCSLRARPEVRAVLPVAPPPAVASRDAADIPAPPPRLLTC